VDEAVGGLHRVAGDAVIAKLAAKSLDPAFVGLGREALEVAPGGQVARHLLRRQVPQLILADACADDRNVLRFDARLRQGREEGDVGVAVERAEHAVGLGGEDHLDGAGKLPVAEGHVGRPGRLETRRGQRPLDDQIGRSREDVVAAEQEEPLATATCG
jgi:hypothetical protein